MAKSPDSTPETHLVTIATTTQPSVAEVIKLRLEANDIRCEIGNESQAGFAGVLKVEIIVREQDVAQAKAIIEEENLLH
jgi:hypothetical protein